ncbi:Hypothetical predicted protein [Paramuricea clavata]|uniref:Uncharacterized protein n=2 Tax=Paramuricea clavata TaxID=317549 RepID=A0A7D9IFX2_PARCT|nr:Hypothetical predicted protein [Paramuricea clavata]
MEQQKKLAELEERHRLHELEVRLAEAQMQEQLEHDEDDDYPERLDHLEEQVDHPIAASAWILFLNWSRVADDSVRGGCRQSLVVVVARQVVHGIGQKRHSDGDLFAQTTDKVWLRGEDMEDRCQPLGEINSLMGVYGRGDGFRLGFTRGCGKHHHPMLHPAETAKDGKKDVPENQNEERKPDSSAAPTRNVQTGHCGATGTIRNRRQRFKYHFVKESLVEELNSNGQPIDITQGRMKEPYAIRTPLGWSVAGPMESASVNEFEDDTFTEKVNKMFQMDFSETLPKVHKLSSPASPDNLNQLTGRPIITVHSWTTSNVSKLFGTELDNIILQLKNLYISQDKRFSLIYNSSELVDILQQQHITDINNFKLTTFDFSSLYTNITFQDTINTIIKSCELLKHSTFYRYFLLNVNNFINN